jgi:hypothetical protein
MDLRQQILKEHSKSQTTKIVNWIGNDQQRFDALFNIFLNDEPMVVQRAAWPLRYAATINPPFIYRHFKKLLDNLAKKGIHDAVTRNTVRVLEDIVIPVKFEGRVMDICFNYTTDPKEKAAVKASSLSILQKLSLKYPEIKPELRTVIESQWDNEGAAFRSRAKRILKNLK